MAKWVGLTFLALHGHWIAAFIVLTVIYIEEL
jgi:hypothetical protein